MFVSGGVPWQLKSYVHTTLFASIPTAPVIHAGTSLVLPSQTCSVSIGTLNFSVSLEKGAPPDVPVAFFGFGTPKLNLKSTLSGLHLIAFRLPFRSTDVAHCSYVAVRNDESVRAAAFNHRN